MFASRPNCLMLAFAQLSVFLVLLARTVAQELPTARPEDVGVSSKKVEELSKFMQSLVDQGKIAGGVTMMARHGEVIHLKAVGMADREEKKPMQKDSIFRIASMTKPITSVAIMMLWEEGKLDLDDPVSKYIPEFKHMGVLVSVDPRKTVPAKREITIRHLLTHMAGFGYSSTPVIGPFYREVKLAEGLRQEDCTLAENMATLANLPLLFHPGERWEYGVSTDVLGRVVEVASGMTFDEFLKKQLFIPLKMKDTCFYLPERKAPRLVAAYRLNDTGTVERLSEDTTYTISGFPYSIDYPYRGPRKYFSGNAGLCSTVPDYMRSCQMMLNAGQLNGQRILKSETVAIMTENHIGELTNMYGQKFGLGFQIIESLKEGDPDGWRGCCGWDGAFTTTFAIHPENDWAVVAMTQVVWNDESHPWCERVQQLAAEAVVD